MSEYQPDQQSHASHALLTVREAFEIVKNARANHGYRSRLSAIAIQYLGACIRGHHSLGKAIVESHC